MADSPDEKKERISTITDAVKKVIDSYAVGHLFYGNELKDDCIKLVPQYQNAYVDTFLKMARRHRRDSFISIDRNNSLYKRVESNFEKEKRIIKEKQEAEERKLKTKNEQLNFSFLSYAFLVVFFVVFLGFGLTELVFFMPASLMANKSDSKYIPAGPMRLCGAIPFRWSRFLTPSEDMPKILDISTTVYSFIPPIITAYSSIYQVKKVIFSRIRDSRKAETSKVCHFDTLLYKKTSFFRDIGTEKKLKFFYKNLDNPHGFGTICICTTIGTVGQIKKRQPEAPGAEWHKVAKGEFYEERRAIQISVCQ